MRAAVPPVRGTEWQKLGNALAGHLNARSSPPAPGWTELIDTNDESADEAFAMRKQPQLLPSPPSTIRSKAPYFLLRLSKLTTVVGGLFSASVKVNQAMSGLWIGQVYSPRELLINIPGHPLDGHRLDG